MNIFCAGINHRLASVAIREQLAISDREAPCFLSRLLRAEGTTGAVVLSTCNRVEVYAATICPAHTSRLLRELLSDRCQVHYPLYEFHTPASVRHLYRVASGLDSMVLGETEILGQVKRAYSLAAHAGTLCKPLHKLF
ncbi:MAG: glutamyl-tRNA reductase, partial [Chthoniobacterales bacterium]|nr:glutamyl-tRNA reductase [Chthoniobacterales bacterium]